MERGTMSQGIQVASKTWKCKRGEFPPRVSRNNSALLFVLESTSILHLQDNKFVLFWDTKFVITLSLWYCLWRKSKLKQHPYWHCSGSAFRKCSLLDLSKFLASLLFSKTKLLIFPPTSVPTPEFCCVLAMKYTLLCLLSYFLPHLRC